MLGFDAIGRLALGQLSRIGLTNTVLLAGSGSFTETGVAATFGLLQASSGASCSLTGNPATFAAKLAAASMGSYSFTGNASMFSMRLAAAAGNVAFTGGVSVFAARITAGAGSYTVTGNAMPLVTSINAGVGSYVVTGYPAVFTRDFEAWFPRPFETGEWTGAAFRSVRQRIIFISRMIRKKR
jgi:hypothetical protein